MKNFIGLMPFEAQLSGEAREIVGRDKLPRLGSLPSVVDGSVTGMPEPKEDTIYVVNAMVFNALAGSRDDVCMFDPEKAVRFDEGEMAGKVKAQGGFLFSKK